MTSLSHLNKTSEQMLISTLQNLDILLQHCPVLPLEQGLEIHRMKRKINHQSKVKNMEFLTTHYFAHVLQIAAQLRHRKVNLFISSKHLGLTRIDLNL